MEIIAEGLRFPEGPVVMTDGSVIVVEIEAGRITRITPDGAKTTVAETGGGPNGAAVGPDGKLYICNNGGFHYINGGTDEAPFLVPHGQAENYSGGRIERVDIATGEVEILYKDGDFGCVLRGPNDIVFDDAGGFWFTDHGKTRPRERDVTGVFYARADGSLLKEVIFPSENPNGIGLSPDGKRLYVAETYTCKLWAYNIASPGEIAFEQGLLGPQGQFLYSPGGFTYFDSLGVEADGNICVATIGECGISVISPEGQLVEFVQTTDPFTTNIAFGGEDMQTAYICLSATGQLLKMDWKRAGLRLNY
ncbi:MAG: SMP-30/gluconolactonase/LRE family protein [Pseudomonadota bacterium]